VRWDGSSATFKSIISLFFASNSFFARSSASAFFPSVFVSASAAASPSAFFVSGSVEYHLDVARLEAGAKARFDGRTCGCANEE